jgi:hypothetical protein
MLEQKIEALTQAVIELTERLGKSSDTTNVQPTPAADAKPVEVEKVEEKPTVAANDEAWDLKAVQDLAVELAKDRQSELIQLLEKFGVKRVSYLEENQLGDFAHAIKALLSEAA